MPSRNSSPKKNEPRRAATVERLQSTGDQARSRGAPGTFLKGVSRIAKKLMLAYQLGWRADDSRWKAVCAARQTGKDFTHMDEAVCLANVIDKTDVLVAAPSERQSLETLQKAKEWTEAYEMEIADIQEDRDAPGALIKSSIITYPNGSRIIAVPGRPDTVRGFCAHLFATEFAFFDDPAATWKAVLPSVTNPLKGLKCVRLYSTPNGKSGQGQKFYEIIDQNLLNPVPGRKQRWSCHLTTIFDAVKQGLKIDIEEIREAMDDEEGFAQEFNCEFLDGSNVLLPYDLIALAESAEATEFCEPSRWTSRASSPIYLGIDFGRSNDPTVCWAVESIGGIFWTREVLVLKGMSSPQQQEILSARIRQATRVCFDYTGPGIGLGDYLVRPEAGHGEFDPAKHKLGKIELCTFTLGFKREIFPKLRRAFEGPTKLRIPVSVAVREDLHAMAQIVRNGEYNYAAPRTAEGHSDRCTALALAVRAAGSEAPFHFQSIKNFTRGGTKEDRFNRRVIA